MRNSVVALPEREICVAQPEKRRPGGLVSGDPQFEQVPRLGEPARGVQRGGGVGLELIFFFLPQSETGRR